MQQAPAKSSRRAGEIPATDVMSHDQIIMTLQAKVEKLEQEKSEWETKAQLAIADRDPIEALEQTIAQLVTERSPNTAQSAGSNNPFASYRNSATTPTPAGPCGQRLVDTSIAQELVESSPVMADQSSPRPVLQPPTLSIGQAFTQPVEGNQEETQRVSFSTFRREHTEKPNCT
ncbi:uncharacterized protein MELLADRAFT_105117 [Melampsora larici-populina 98AG31]|uniref:Uncharacterized protein n=1 Tax=Melampsora larici-populina (strain 98AG31 / pathotype 3-4-7) TaxID=747676 RepID=F4RHG9_MELLP|nr:uncharacterized protein MELLADRAFT_105117 [Melampsora larici-populina 98AG31]EGG08169.1 hypothetical protein MELLADRAFT_105117 [Melampsora larici-populina 98AG31]